MRPLLCGVALIGLVAGLPALGQGVEDLTDDAGGLRLTFGTNQRLETGRNLTLDIPEAGNGAILSNTLSFGLTSETRIQSLAIAADATLRTTDLPDEDREFSVGDANLNLDYTREVADAILTFGIDYNRAEIDFLDPLSDFTDGDGGIDLPDDFADLEDEGVRSAYDVNAALELGREDLIGYRFTLGAGRVDYTDTTDPDLTDTRTTRAGAGLTLRFSPRTTGLLDLTVVREQEDDLLDTDQLTRTVTAGVDYDLTPRARIAARLGYFSEDTDELGVETTESGGIGSLGLVYDVANGTITADLETSRDSAGRLNTFTIGRTLDLPDGGTFAATLGVADPEIGDLAVIGSLAYRQQFGPSDVIVNATREIATSDEDEARATTTLSLGYIYNLSPVARMGLNVAYVQIDETPTEGAVDRADVSAIYSRDLTETWDINGGVTYRMRDEADEGKATSTSVFVSLARRFEFRP